MIQFVIKIIINVAIVVLRGMMEITWMVRVEGGITKNLTSKNQLEIEDDKTP